MLDTMESRITFEVPSNLDFDKLIRDNNYTLFWQNLHSEPFRSKESGNILVEDPNQGDRNSSDFNLMSSLKHFVGARGGADGWGLPPGSVVGAGVGSQFEDPLVDQSVLWIGAVMVLLILSGLFCVCSCYLYYKYRRWQKCVSLTTCQTMASMDIEAPPAYDIETLPSYTIASGLPSYEDAVRHLAQEHYHRQQTRAGYEPAMRKPSAAYGNSSIHPPAMVKFFESRPQNWLNVTIFEEIHYNFVGRGMTGDDPAAAVPTSSSGGLLSESTAKAANSGGSKETKSDSDNGFFKIQVCMVENEKNQCSNR